MQASTLGLSVIARDEEATLPHLLVSIEGAFDQVALLDTGSVDSTVSIFEEWAETQRGTDCKLGRFEWCDDFAAARNAANALLTTDWLAWADCDDTIRGARWLRQVASEQPDEAVSISFPWYYCGGWTRRERIQRRGFERWIGRVHEGQPAEGRVFTGEGIRRWNPGNECNPEIAWVHSGSGEVGQTEHGPKWRRNMRIIEAWTKELPGHPTPVAYRATEELSRGERQTALGYFRDFLALPRVRREFGAERIDTALAVLPTIEPRGRVNDYVLGKPLLAWLDDPAFDNVPLCPDPGAALLDRRLAKAA